MKRTRKRRNTKHQSVALETSYANYKRCTPVYDLASVESIDKIHDNSMRILEDIGIDFRDEEALETWKQAGAKVEGERVRIPRELLLELVSMAPDCYTHHSRNPERSVLIGKNNMAFAPIYGSPFIRDFDGVRRTARLEDFHNLVKLAYLHPAMNLSGGTICEPNDIAVETRHLDMLYAHIKLSDKPFMGSVTHASRAQDCVDMCRVLFGVEFVEKNTVMTSLINCNSPLVWDATMLSVIRVYAVANQACIISPFIMQGANTLITTAGAMSQLNAEALAGIAYVQLIRPGAPVVYGATLSTVSMQTGSPMYGTTETQQLMFLTGQLARRYELPMRTGGMRTGSKAPDAQAAYESTQTMLPSLLAGGNFFLHSAGWLESGLSACYAKFIMDADQLITIQRLTAGLGFSDEDFAIDTIDEVGPGGHYLGCAHTLERYRGANYMSEVANQMTYEQWSEEGSQLANERAIEIVKSKLASYKPPPLDQKVDDALLAFMNERKTELLGAVAASP